MDSALGIHGWIHDALSLGNIIILLGIYGKLRVALYQHRLVWKWFAKEHKIDSNGHS